MADAGLIRCRAADREFQCIVGGARVAVRVRRDAKQDFLAGFHALIAQTAFFVEQRPPQKLRNQWRRQRIQNVNLGAR